MIATLLGRLPQPRSEEGFTLMETMIAVALAIVVFGPALSALENGQRVQARDTEWALTMAEGRTGLARMAREIRQASKIEEKTASSVYFLATIAGMSWKIKYQCNVAESGTTYDECVRFAAEGSSSLPATGTPIIRDVLNGTEVFTYLKEGAENTSAPTLVDQRIELPSGGTLGQSGVKSSTTHRVVLENASYMRNLDLAG